MLLNFKLVGIYVCLVSLIMVGLACGQKRQFASVSPSLEIEVINPGVDSMNNPAIEIKDGIVDIPPVLLVHRYYYSGDRSFQGPLLPGGPSILVVNHPKTGERVYVPAQMMPGAPRVTYTKKGITYDYGKNAIMLHFGRGGKPSLKYRSGYTLQQKVGRVLHADKMADHLQKAKTFSKDLCQRGKTTMVGITADIAEGAKVITVPAKNILQSLPLGKKIFSGDLEGYYAQRAAEFRRDKRNKHAERQARLDDASISTNR